MIVVWIVTCNQCGKWIDARREEYYNVEYRGDFCEECFRELEEQEGEQVSSDKRGGDDS